MTSFIPECPYCKTRLDESIPSVLQGSVQVRCPSCRLLYSYSKEFGSFPVEEEFNYHLSPGLFGRMITIGSKEDQGQSDQNSKGMNLVWLCLFSPILVLALLLIVVLVLSIVNT